MKKDKNGFTIVELLIVIVVIGILAALVLNSFAGAQAKARDTTIKNAASALVRAVSVWSIETGTRPSAAGFGWGSTGNDGNGTCTGGISAGWFSTGTYTCTLEEILIAKRYIPANFTSSLPPNKNYNNYNSTTVMFYPCNGHPNDYVVLYYLEAPTAEDTNSFNDIATKCLFGTNLRDEYGMRGLKLFTVSN